jgi:protein tyrosine phosphatase
MILPFERTYWVVPGKLLAGEIPSSKIEIERQSKVQNLIRMDFDAVINLMEDGEKTFSGETLVDYSHDLQFYAAESNREISIYRFPIRDLSIPTPDAMKENLALIRSLIEGNKKVYVHCWGGVGRTGTVIGCYLLENQMANRNNVIRTIDYLKRTTSIKDRRSPETDEQMEFILNWKC